MKRGRPRLPDEVKRRRGNPGKRKLNPPEVLSPSALSRLPVPPAWLPKKALPLWKEMVSLAIANRILTPLDKPEFANLVHTEFVLRKAAKQLERQGLMVKGSVGQMVKNPLIGVVRDYSALAMRLRSGFGMNPSARSGVKPAGMDVPDGKKGEKPETELTREEQVVQPFRPRIIEGGKKR